jgi:hypothetical protein
MRFAGILGGLCLTLAAHAIPQVLIVQRPDPKAPADSLPMKLDLTLAGVFDKEGRVIPVVWSEADPLFRSYRDERQVTGPIINPSDSDIVKTAKSINAKYVITLSATLIDEKL